MFVSYNIQQFFLLLVMLQVMRHDVGPKREIGTMSEAYPHLIFENFTT